MVSVNLVMSLGRNISNSRDSDHRLQEHIITTHKSKEFPKKVVEKIKSVMDIPKKHGVAMVQTVRKNMEGYNKHNIQGAYLAHKAQAVLAHPLDKTFLQTVSGISGISNVPHRPHDQVNPNNIYGSNLGGHRGKSVRFKHSRANEETVHMPRDLYRLHHFVTLVADVMFVNFAPIWSRY